jgi:hypothetical protein
MAQNFIGCDREQALLLPSSLREWPPEGHLAWFVIDAVAAMDLMAFYVSYRVDGWGRAAHDPAMMVAQALIALRELAGDRVRVTLLAPEPDELRTRRAGRRSRRSANQPPNGSSSATAEVTVPRQ